MSTHPGQRTGSPWRRREVHHGRKKQRTRFFISKASVDPSFRSVAAIQLMPSWLVICWVVNGCSRGIPTSPLIGSSTAGLKQHTSSASTDHHTPIDS